VSAKTLCACVLVLAASACAKNPSPGDAGAAAPATTRNRDVIARDELQAPGIVGLSVLDAVKSLRPQFLTVRTVSTGYVPGTTDDEAGQVHSSLDGSKVGPLNDLATIRASTVKEIRYLNAAAAHEKFGQAAHQGPVIVVTTM
jgi:hypothetical protein